MLDVRAPRGDGIVLVEAGVGGDRSPETPEAGSPKTSIAQPSFGAGTIVQFDARRAITSRLAARSSRAEERTITCRAPARYASRATARAISACSTRHQTTTS
jgi:hypothetical protein